jgi:hypothetical protein
MTEGSLAKRLVEVGRALNQALFQEVPFILDSLWRHGEFRANRLGSVDFRGQGELKVRAAWMSGAFGMFVFVATFAIFGPTLDAMCSVEDVDFARWIRLIAAGLLLVVAIVIFFPTVNSTSYHLWRKAEKRVNARCEQDAKIRERWTRVREVIDADERRYGGDARGTLRDRVGSNLRRLVATYPFLPFGDLFALTMALFVLMSGALLLAAPFIITALTLVKVRIDTLSCIQVVNEKLVWAQVIGLALALAGGFATWKRWGNSRPFRVFIATFALLAGIVGLLWWKWSPVEASESAGGFYPHVYVIIVGVLLVMALFARWLALRLFRCVPIAPRRAFRDALRSEDLLAYERDAPEVSGVKIWSAVINGVGAHLLHFLLMPAFVAFIAPTAFLYPLVAGFAFISLVLLTYGSLSSRWEQMIVYVQRWFLVGTPRVLSVMVIVIAQLRLFNVTYVSTVIDATPIGVLAIIVVMTYVAVWLFEHWINRWLAGELLRLLGGRPAADRGFVNCRYSAQARKSWAKPNYRYLAVHGTGRLCALGWYEGKQTNESSKAERGPAFVTYTFVELFNALAGGNKERGELAKDIRRRIAIYFSVINSLLIVAFIGLFMWHRDWSRPLVVTPMVNVESALEKESQPLATQMAQAPQEAPADLLGSRLVEQAANGRPSIVIAASGGGTRAAVYTAIALEGMGKIDHAKDVVLLSGVSGGGVSAAVFASRYESLTASAPRPGDEANAWSVYVHDVGEPFIQDVLEGIGEVRIWGPTSLGALLQESLARRAFNAKQTGIHTMDQLRSTGLILNTAISGHPYDDAEILKDRIATPKYASKLNANGECVRDARPYASLAGGRLIFTNLENVSGFPQRSPDAHDMWLPYRIINFGKVELPAASALTANFPPVFSNARVRITSTAPDECPQSYFVTDGGATENLGLVSALFALRGTLDRLPAEAQLSEIHVVALEASAIDYDYKDDRGLGAATGGSKERINAGLTQTLLTEVHRLAEEKHHIQVTVHYLPLPVAFRSRGGFGTHWMFAPIVRVANPHLPEKPDDSMFADSKADTVDLDRQEVTATLRAMFDPAEPICERAARIHLHPENAQKDYTLGWTVDTQRVARWICRFDDQRGREAPMPDYQVDAWKKLVAALKSAP